MKTQELFNSITKLDQQGKFISTSYNFSQNNSLGENWWALSPFGSWSNFPNRSHSSPLEDLLRKAVNDVIDTEGVNTECFIDLFSLSYAKGNIFNDPANSPTLIKTIANYINSLPASTTPVIRYIIGLPPPSQRPVPASDAVVEAFFSGQITHPKAMFYWGNFSPSFSLSSSEQVVDEAGNIKSLFKNFWQWLISKTREYDQEIAQEIERWEQETEKWVAEIGSRLILRTCSWNHAKIFAMNGYSLVTGGNNYSPEYQTWPTTVVCDLDMYINGGAAVDAHHFANYFWQYLNSGHATDNSSWAVSSPIAGGCNFTNCTNAPLFASTGSFSNPGSLNALSVARNGNLTFLGVGYPAQIVDALRDLLLNIVAVGVETKFSSRIDFIGWLALQLSDDNEEFINFLDVFGINPACWSTRYARSYAIKNANTQVRLSQQAFVQYYLANSKWAAYTDLVNKVNAFFGSSWNGYIWPFDLLISMSYALTTMSHNRGSAEGINIVCSFYNEGWQDMVKGKEFKAKLLGVMNGLTILHYISPVGNNDELVNNWVTYKRINPINQSGITDYGNHCKIVLVDDSLCYVGSDNAYPSYNEEFGLWVDDSISIQNFINEYWTGLWQNAQVQD